MKSLPRSFNRSFRNYCHQVMNERFNEFEDEKYLLCFFLNSQFRATPLKKGAYAKIVKTAITIGQNLGFDLQEQNALCSQLRKYKDKEAPFDLEFATGYEEPINYCERGFSSLGWLTHKLRIQIGIEKLESISKMITYWKSNAEKEFRFYGKQSKDKQKLNEAELNKRVTEALAEVDDINQDNDEIEKSTRILEDIGEIPDDADDDYIDDENVNTDGESRIEGKDIMNYDIDDLVNKYRLES
ncbi:unnamed protein product [Rhizophagus irregularis]|nr:unnamed protein product [Rhizophagus irregularis]